MRVSHERDLRDLLRRVRGRWMTVAASGLVARTAGALSLVFLAAAVTERIWQPRPPGLLLVGALAVALGLLVAGHAARACRRLPLAPEVARFIEERCPELEDRLASATDVTVRSAPSAFEALIVADAAAYARGLDIDRIVSRGRVRRALGTGALGVAGLVVTSMIAADSAARVGRAAWFYGFPTSIELHVSPGDARVPAGRAVQIVARVRAPLGLPDGVQPMIVVDDDAGRQSTPMTVSDGGFVFDVRRVTSGFAYQVVMGALASPEYRVTALFQPRVARIDLTYDYPVLTGLDRRVEEDGGDIYAPAGTQVRLQVHVDKPVRSGVLVMGTGRRIALDGGTERILESTLRISEHGSYRVALVDEDSLTSAGEAEYFIRVMDDRPPTVRIIRPASDRQVTPIEEVTIAVRADDDYGLERVELVYSVRGGAEHVTPIGSVPLGTSLTAAHTLLLEDLDVRPGDFVTYYARARDVSRGKESSEVRSDIFFLEVRNFEEEFARAQTMAGMGGRGGDMSDLAATQKEIIVATWKLDRLSIVGGRSDADIKVLARAQGELRQRAAQAVGPFAPSNSPQVGHGLTRGRTSERPMARILAAMGRAEASLDAMRTADALPHEMEALNELLKVEAEVQRRQVARQGGNGSQSNRSQRDLSALFDRELQRQQQTNYETRTSVDERDEERESDVLRRVRELAHRQDALSEAHRRLDGQMRDLSPEERKRQLERLVREQRELREEAEALGRQLAARHEGDSRRSAIPGGERLRDAMEEMRRAMSSLLREDLAHATARGDRAAEQLRALERNLRGTIPAERGRALGEMQLEARQLAEAERRMANEARHLTPDRAGSDLRRRIAGQRERLADRVDQLDEGLRALAATAESAKRGPLDEAVRELRDEKLAQRLRAAAGTLRNDADDVVGQEAREAEPSRASRGGETEGVNPHLLAEADQEMAKVLDRVAERLGAALDGRVRKTAGLSEGLSRARELRERLTEIERSVDAATREGDGGQDATVARLHGEYVGELRRAGELLEELRREHPALDGTLNSAGRALETRSASGTEAFKQDFAEWEVLRREAQLALEQYEASRSREQSEREARDRLNVGGSNEIPAEYRTLVEKYYRLLATKKK